MPGLDLGEVQDVVDDDQEVLGRNLDARGQLVLVVVEGGLEQQLGEPYDPVHGSADLVAHGGQELRLGLGCHQCPVAGGGQVLGGVAGFGHVPTVEHVAAHRGVVTKVGGRPGDRAPGAIAVAHAGLEGGHRRRSLREPAQLAHHGAGVVGVHESGDRAALQVPGRVAEHPLRRGGDIGDLEVHFGHHDHVPGVVDQRTEAGRVDGLGPAHREDEPYGDHQEGGGGQRKRHPSDMPDAGGDEDGQAGQSAEDREGEPGGLLACWRCRR